MAGRPRVGRLTSGWPKSLLRCFRASLQINPNELFGQPSHITVTPTEGFPRVVIASSSQFQGSEAQSVAPSPTSPQGQPRVSFASPPLLSCLTAPFTERSLLSSPCWHCSDNCSAQSPSLFGLHTHSKSLFNPSESLKYVLTQC